MDIKSMRHDLHLLVDYAREHKQSLNDVASASKLLLDTSDDVGGDQQTMQSLAESIAKLQPQEEGVTAATLRATECEIVDGKAQLCEGPVRRYLRRLWYFTALFAFVAFLHAALPDAMPPLAADAVMSDGRRIVFVLLEKLVPFTYGGLGACAYLMRVTGQHLHTRTFDLNRIAEHWNRLALGTLSGGMIVLFVDSVDQLRLSAAALGFVAGYSVDFLFQAIDRVMAAILPKVGIDTMALQADSKRARLALKRLQERADQETNTDKKKLLQEVVEELKP